MLTSRISVLEAVVVLCAVTWCLSACRDERLGSSHHDAGTDGWVADGGVTDGSTDPCRATLQEELLLANESIGHLSASPSGRYLGILLDYDWSAGTGPLVVHDLLESTTIEVAP